MTELSKNAQVPQCDKTAVSKSVFMATYLKITGNKEKLMSDFIEQQKKYWFVSKDMFTGIRTVHYNTDDELKIQIEELEKYLQDEKIEFKKTENSISVKSEYVYIYYSS